MFSCALETEFEIFQRRLNSAMVVRSISRKFSALLRSFPEKLNFPKFLPPKKTKPSSFSKPERFLGYEGSVHSYFDGEWRELPFFERSKLTPGAHFAGPALVFEQHSATVIEGGWHAEVDGAGALVLKTT